MRYVLKLRSGTRRAFRLWRNCAHFLDTSFGFTFEQIRWCKRSIGWKMINPDSFIASCRTRYHLHSVLNHRYLNLGYCTVHLRDLWDLLTYVTSHLRLPPLTMILAVDDCPTLNAKYLQSYECRLRRMAIQRNSRWREGRCRPEKW